ncbi:hypothetical protein COJ45_05390 [Bacillus cereus]|nr:hypothetical protein COJ45_05390 [Bacillus cereus]
MKVDKETIQRAYEQLYEAFEVIVQWFKQTWNQIKGIAIEYIKYKLEQPQRQTFGYVKHKVMKSQVIDRKPRCVRARTVC